MLPRKPSIYYRSFPATIITPPPPPSQPPPSSPPSRSASTRQPPIVSQSSPLAAPSAARSTSTLRRSCSQPFATLKASFDSLAEQYASRLARKEQEKRDYESLVKTHAPAPPPK